MLLYWRSFYNGGVGGKGIAWEVTQGLCNRDTGITRGINMTCIQITTAAFGTR